MSDLFAFYRATYREGFPVPLAFAAVFLFALILEVMK